MLIYKTQQIFIKWPRLGTLARNKYLYDPPLERWRPGFEGSSDIPRFGLRVAEGLSLMLLFLGEKKNSVITTCLTE